MNNNWRHPRSYSVLFVKVNSQSPARVERNACDDMKEDEHDSATVPTYDIKPVAVSLDVSPEYQNKQH